MRAYLCVLGNALILAGCASPYVEVSHVQPHLTGAPADGSLAAAEQAMKKAMREEHAKSFVALADCLTALQAESRVLERDPRNATAIRDYDFGIARIFQIIHDAKLDPWSAPLTVPSSDGDFTLTHEPDLRPEWNPALYEFTPADEFDVGGKYVTERITRYGIGAPIVAVERKPKNRRADFAPSRIFYSVTVVAHFEGRRCVLSFEDPLAIETVAFNGHTVPLAADFTVPLAVMLQESDPQKHEFARLLNPEKYARTAAIERLQPYDPNKTVVLVIHGLKDSQATWAPMINKLRGDPVIRKHYQFWFYSYPTGYPFPYSAAILFFRHRPEIGRVIFIAAPLRGSNMAKGVLGSLAGMLIREATLSSQASREMLRLTRIEDAELKPMRRSNSVDSLSPRS